VISPEDKEKEVMKYFYGTRFFWILGAMALATVLVGPRTAAAGPPPPTQIWSDANIDLGGGESLATSVATKGSNIYVAVSGKDSIGDWYGQVRCYDALKAYKWSSDPFPLNSGRTTQIAVAGSKVFVAGYYGEKGTVNQEVFVRAYDAAGKKGFQWQGSTAAPYCGNYPIGVKALGSKVVAFYNSGVEAAVRGSLAGFSANQKDGQTQWTNNFGYPGDVSNKVNDIAIKGSQFAAVGTHQDAFWNYFEVAIYSATNGNYLQSSGASFGSTGDVEEALAVAWVGSYLGAVGQVSDAFGQVGGFFWGLKVSNQSMTEVWANFTHLGGDTTMNAVAISGPNAYAAGYGKTYVNTQTAFVRSFALAPETAKHPHGNRWNRSLVTDNISTTGLVVSKNGVYVSGYGNNGGNHTDWFVVAYDLDGNDKWLQDYNLAGKDTNQALGLAAASRAIVAVGQCMNASDNLEGVVEALVP
jgi:hypothetical protein